MLQILSYPGVVEFTTQLLILKNILWLPLCRINKFGLNTLPSKAVAIPYTCGLSQLRLDHATLFEEDRLLGDVHATRYQQALLRESWTKGSLGRQSIVHGPD